GITSSVTDNAISFQNQYPERNKNDASSSCPAPMGSSMKNRNTIFTTIKKLTLALLIGAVINVPAAEAILVPLPEGGLQSGVPYVFRISANTSDVAVTLQALLRNRLELE